MSKIKQLATEEDFKAALSKAGDKPVFVDFSANWCGPCKRIGPKFEEYANTQPYSDRAFFYKIDVDENDEVAEKYDVQSLPTFICFKNHLKVERMVGANEDKLKEFIDKHTDPTGQ